jgi:hypothetical protein
MACYGDNFTFLFNQMRYLTFIFNKQQRSCQIHASEKYIRHVLFTVKNIYLAMFHILWALYLSANISKTLIVKFTLLLLQNSQYGKLSSPTVSCLFCWGTCYNDATFIRPKSECPMPPPPPFLVSWGGCGVGLSLFNMTTTIWPIVPAPDDGW